MNIYSKKNALLIFLVLFGCFLILPTTVFAQPEDDGEEEPIQAYPNPLENEISDAKAMQLMKTQLTEMGFTVGKISKVADGKFVVTVTSWNKAKMKPRYKDSVALTQTKNKRGLGKGTISVTVNKTGIFFNNTSFKAMGLKLNAANLKQSAIIK